MTSYKKRNLLYKRYIIIILIVLSIMYCVYSVIPTVFVYTCALILTAATFVNSKLGIISHVTCKFFVPSIPQMVPFLIAGHINFVPCMCHACAYIAFS